jgi:dephospho-CoA kinase
MPGQRGWVVRLPGNVSAQADVRPSGLAVRSENVAMETERWSSAEWPSTSSGLTMFWMSPPPQRRIGLTGGIASGKSTVGRVLAGRFGLPVLDADVYAREALAPGTPATAAVLARYGTRVETPDPTGAASLDRAALGRLVFADPGEKRWLEQLVHPIVRRRFDAKLTGLSTAPAVVLMIPLLFEAGLEGLCSEIWLVDCDEAAQLERLITRDHCSEADARARIAAQWPLARKRALADVVIDNREEHAELIAQLEQALAHTTASRGGAKHRK